MLKATGPFTRRSSSAFKLLNIYEYIIIQQLTLLIDRHLHVMARWFGNSAQDVRPNIHNRSDIVLVDKGERGFHGLPLVRGTGNIKLLEYQSLANRHP